MKKLSLIVIALFASLVVSAQYPRNKVAIEDGTGTW